MCLPEGWVTDVAGISRNDHKMAEAVVPAQCAARPSSGMDGAPRSRSPTPGPHLWPPSLRPSPCSAPDAALRNGRHRGEPDRMGRRVRGRPLAGRDPSRHRTEDQEGPPPWTSTGSPASKPTPFANLSSDGSRWIPCDEHGPGLFEPSELPVTWPTSGMSCGGTAYALPTWAQRTGGSSLPLRGACRLRGIRRSGANRTDRTTRTPRRGRWRICPDPAADTGCRQLAWAAECVDRLRLLGKRRCEPPADADDPAEHRQWSRPQSWQRKPNSCRHPP